MFCQRSLCDLRVDYKCPYPLIHSQLSNTFKSSKDVSVERFFFLFFFQETVGGATMLGQ